MITVEDPRNVIDRYKGLPNHVIKQARQDETLPYAVLIDNVEYNINIGTIIRSANAFGARQVYYYGMKKWNRTSALGSYHYVDLHYLKTLEELRELKSQYTFVGLEFIDTSHELSEYNWKPNSMLVFGSEATGISPELLELCEDKVKITQLGTIRSINVACAASIAMHDVVRKLSVAKT